MLNRDKFDHEIAILENVASKHDNCDFNNIVEKIKNLREQFEIKVMMIGHFNAGKSALLNCLIKRDDFLTEAQTPQTAIATELKFSENENYFAVVSSKGGAVKEFDVMKSSGNYADNLSRIKEFDGCDYHSILNDNSEKCF